MARLKEKYVSEVVPRIQKARSIQSNMRVPRLQKIVVNVGLGEALANPKALEAAEGDLRAITGQKPVVRRARKSISNFKLREGMAIGLSVTLRGERMYEFFDRLVSVAIPRIRDFRGVPTRSFDGRGNYTLGIKEQIIFPEINYDKVDRIRGMNVTICTSAPNDEEARELLAELGMPFAEAKPVSA